MNPVLTVKEVASLFKCSESEIRARVQEGKLKPLKDVPGVKFSADYINKIIGMDLEPLSPFERRKLLQQIDVLKHDIEQLNNNNDKLKNALKEIAEKITIANII